MICCFVESLGNDAKIQTVDQRRQLCCFIVIFLHVSLIPNPEPYYYCINNFFCFVFTFLLKKINFFFEDLLSNNLMNGWD